MGTKDFHAMGSILDAFERFSFVWVQEFKNLCATGSILDPFEKGLF